MNKRTIISLALITVLAPTLAIAKSNYDKKAQVNYTGPVEVSSVAELLDNTGMFSEQKAITEGYLIKQIDHETYVFSDGSKEIEVELEDHVKLRQPIDAETKVRLYGEFEGGLTPEFEVDHIKVL